MSEYIANEIYPLTIVADRYTGTYSGGKYTAWNITAGEIPTEINDSDVECFEFWHGERVRNYIIGKGSTVDAALADLYCKLRSQKR